MTAWGGRVEPGGGAARGARGAGARALRLGVGALARGRLLRADHARALRPDELARAIERIYGLADPPDSVLFVEGYGMTAYDRSVLTFYERDVKRVMPRRVCAVIRRPFRMVVRATALGFGW